MAITFENQVFHLTGKSFSYLLRIRPDGIVEHLYWGSRLPDDSAALLCGATLPHSSFDRDEARIAFEFPTQEVGYYRTPCIGVINADGDDVVSLRYKAHTVCKGKPALSGLPSAYAEDDDNAQTLVLTVTDDLTGLTIDAMYTVYDHFDVLCRSVLVRNSGSEKLVMTQLDAANVLLPDCEYDTIHLKGSWARERNVTRQPFCQSVMKIESRRGASGHEENPFLALCSHETTEHVGQVYAMTLVYSGSFQALAESSNAENTRLSIGMNPAVNRWLLSPGETFQSPEALLVYSCQGLNGMSHCFHDFIRLRICRGYWRDRPRPILTNNWEATTFHFTEEQLLPIVRSAAKIGCEMFVLDDGWFGKRDNDHCSLGDWFVDYKKLPDGLCGLAEKVHGENMLFGLWFEPEMVSPDSELYRAHPDWCLHVPGRPRSEARNQLILDLSRAEIQEYLLTVITDILDKTPVDYIKWDMNRNMTEAFSQSLSAEHRMETQHRYMLGLYHVIDTLTKRYPKILFEGCSGGGGRFDCGMLSYMPQFWTSDDTDAMERTRIQYGTSLVYPPCTMGAHVSAVPNQQTGRITSLQTRCDVAACGNFGFEMDLSLFTPEEEETACAAVKMVKALRPTILSGRFTRLSSPFEGSYAAWMIADENTVVLFCALHMCHPKMMPHRLYPTGLCETAMYREKETGMTVSGGALMHMGYPVWLKHDFETKLIVFERV